jgi:acetolactate synthase-1/2/3 large subunit
MKVSDYIAEFLKKNGIKQCFSVTGGFAMHLNDSFGEKLDVVYQHGEAPCGYSAMGYSKMNQEPSVVCVTAGCGATNAITPCLVAYQDSVPVFFISGAVQSKENVRFLKHSTRTYSGSDCDIIDMVKHITKFSYELTEPTETGVILEKCLWNMTNGRPGPVWLSIPVDVQALQVPEQLDIWLPPAKSTRFPSFDSWNTAKRPVVLVGGGIRNSRTEKQLEDFVKRHQVPVVCSFFGTDLVPEFNVGRVGNIGNRTGNFVIQNADCILILGCRLSKTIKGYRPDWFAREATIISITDEDGCDLMDFFDVNLHVNDHSEWLSQTLKWKDLWFHEIPNPGDMKCPYNILSYFFNTKKPGENVIVSSGSIYCVAWHTCVVKPGDRFISSGHGDMGYEVPCAIGCAIESKKTSWAIVGDGSFQFNVQELQTIKTLRLPVKILYFNNGGYGAIQVTQDSFFKRRHGVEVPCPPVKKVCDAWDIQYFTSIDDAVQFDGPCLVDIECIVQQRYPRLSNVMKPDGTFDNRPMEDMWPFLDRDVFRKNMFIKHI